jgi:hypothetical protein
MFASVVELFGGKGALLEVLQLAATLQLPAAPPLQLAVVLAWTAMGAPIAAAIAAETAAERMCL